MCFVIFAAKFVWKISHSKKNRATYDQIRLLVLMEITRYSCHILMKLEFSRYIFEKYSNIIKRHIDNTKLLLICTLLLLHSSIFNVYMVVFLFNTVIYVFLLLCLIVRLYTYFIFMYSLYIYVSSSCQLALFAYPDCGFSVLFPQI
jgi:hypothetical protein